LNEAGERRRVLRLFAFFLSFASSFFCFAASAEAAQVLRVTVPAVVELEEEACSLAEIAELEGRPDLTERAGALLLSVRDGAISRAQVLEALRVSGLEDVRIELRMPASVRVEPPLTVLDIGKADAALPGEGGGERRGKDALAARIKELAAWDGEVEVNFQGSVPSGRLVSPASIVPGTAAATLRFRDSSGRERSLAVRLVWAQPALVLTRSVKRGETLRESDFVVRSLRVGRAGVYASRLSEAVGRSLRRNLSQGEAIALDLLADVPIIKRGKTVTIVAQDSGLTVRARGEALEDGALGDVINVRNLSAKTVVKAVVVAEDRVEVKVP
jgi:flagella basal body P-ring formation protein FlgA